jgi:hypothetical protein
MKKRLFSILTMFVVLVACNQKNNEKNMEENLTVPDTTMMNNSPETLEIKEVDYTYACPMHPEVMGNSDENCPKCGMALTVPVEKQL